MNEVVIVRIRSNKQIYMIVINEGCQHKESLLLAIKSIKLSRETCPRVTWSLTSAFFVQRNHISLGKGTTRWCIIFFMYGL